jgi:hypothetical protein
VRDAEGIWWSRIEQRVPTLPVWPELSVDELETAGEAQDSAWCTNSMALTEPALGLPISLIWNPILSLNRPGIAGGSIS